MDLPLALIDDLGATYGDSEGMADLTIMVSGVDVGMLIKHTDKQSHFSLRSRDSIDVGAIAKKVTGGGGHCNAAGCTINSPIANALPQMLSLIDATLRGNK
jgi:bifunctional oligoribonuclease and PAP phosphatase NrnA